MFRLALRRWALLAAVLQLLLAAGHAQHFTVFDPPGSVATYAVAVNNDNVVAGYYSDSASHTHGFLRKDRSITSFDVAGSTSTTALAINGSGSIAGYYTDAAYASHGFLRVAGGAVTTFAVSGASGTVAQAINHSGFRQLQRQDCGDIRR